MTQAISHNVIGSLKRVQVKRLQETLRCLGLKNTLSGNAPITVYLARLKLKSLLLVLVSCLFSLNLAHAAEQTKSAPNPLVENNLQAVLNSSNASLVVWDTTDEQVVIDHLGEQARVPASTAKLITTLLSLQRFGEGYRFQTHFYFNENTHVLSIAGMGDPYLVSDEIKQIALELKAAGLQQIKAIHLDNSAFAPKLKSPGASDTDNPYDALPSPIAANFNTVALTKKDGRIESAEEETPLTPFSASTFEVAEGEKIRVNVGRQNHLGERYFAELLSVFLQDLGVTVAPIIEWQPAPDTTPLYTHKNSRTLADMLAPMLKYSNNFIANQLALMLANDAVERAVDFNDVALVYKDALEKTFNWQSSVLEEGAGLSPSNQLTAFQLVDVLESLEPWQHLMPQLSSTVSAKSGTLTGVRSLAGYINLPTGQVYRFALLIEDDVSREYPMLVVDDLVSYLESQLSR